MQEKKFQILTLKPSLQKVREEEEAYFHWASL